MPLPELLAWFTGKDANRRKFPRKKKGYRATYTLDGQTQHPAIGLDISGGGMCFLTQEEAAKDEFEVRATLDQRAVRMRVRVVWRDTVTHQGKGVTRYGVRYSGIPADDWDAVMRYSTGKPVADANKTQDELVAVKMTNDDAARLIPLALQKRMYEMLVQRHRLAPVDDKPPLVQFFYSGLVRYENKPMHRLTIQSKVVRDDGTDMYETRFLFDENGENVLMMN
ncbi:MAG: PilZ domain-containing protein [Vulcanimicrobiaceae bacterium]